MRFADFLRATVLSCAAGATLLALVTVLAVGDGRGSPRLASIAAAWWAAAAIIGLWLGRRADASPPIATLLADARAGRSLPEVNPARTLLNRLWPLLLACVAAAGVAVPLPQIGAVATGFALIWSLAWRRQASAVRAIENRDGVRFFVRRTSPLRRIELVRTPGFRTLTPDPAFQAAGRPPV